MDHNSQAPPLHNQQPHAGGMMLPSGNAYHHHQLATNLSNASPQMIAPNSSALLQKNPFPFNSSVATAPASKPLESLNSAFSGDGSSGLRPGSGGDDGFCIVPVKKKRGRPRKYSPDGGSNIALGLAPAPVSTAAVLQVDHAENPSSEAPSSKKHRGRPPGSGKRQLDALGNCGVGFTPHVIFVKAGEDIASKIMAFAQQGPRIVCVLSANGSICNVMLRQSTSSGGSVTYKGRFEIISLTGSFLLSENSGNQVRTGGLSISLAGPDGRVVGGGVAGMLVAATPVQIIVGSFIANGKKPKYMPSVPDSRMLHFGAPPSAVSPPSQEEASSDSSEDNANAHINRPPGPFNHSSQQMHNMQQMYSPMGWPNSGNPKMLHQ